MSQNVYIVAFGMPVLLSVLGATMVLAGGLAGRLSTDASREWWVRQGAWTAIFVSAWVAIVAVSLYAPAMIGYVNANSRGWAGKVLGSAWLLSTLTGLALGKSSATGDAGVKSMRGRLAGAAPLVFYIGAPCLVSTFVHFLLLPPNSPGAPNNESAPSEFLNWYLYMAMNSSIAPLFATFLGLATAGLLLAWRVDINKFSPHMINLHRLARIYLGAITTRRMRHAPTSFGQSYDVHLDELLETNGQLQRPVHIVNAAFNLVNGKGLTRQMRRTSGFTFTPAFCGFEVPRMASPGGPQLADDALRGGFRRTQAYRGNQRTLNDSDCGITLGMAIAVSGSAASPNMGYHSSPSLAFLMTVFNVRLGRWFANPIRSLGGSKRTPRISPRFGITYLIKELFGQTDVSSNFIYLTDGGHFENLGVYELVRRRCRLIVLVDAGADGNFDFADLGNAIRKCRTDLHIDIEINVAKIEPKESAGFSQTHCVTGTIRYDKTDQGAPIGTLLYIKPSLLGSELADILNYRKTNEAFPHQTTANQSFDEKEFESYRSLGYNIGVIALTEAASATRTEHGGHDISQICEALRARWN